MDSGPLAALFAPIGRIRLQYFEDTVLDPDFHKGPRRGGAAVSRERSSRFVELFRTTPPRTVCPNFYVLRHANGCLFKPLCTYCYLKSSFWYLDRPHVFTNTRELRYLQKSGHQAVML